MFATLTLAAIVGTLGTPTNTVMTDIDPLPAGYRADIGIPVAYDDTYLYLYGDTIPPEGGLARNTAIIDGEVISPALADTASGSWYWPTDAVELDTGELFVVALEMVEGGYLGYEAIDADAFVVTDARNPGSWRLADKIEDGPWGDDQVQFSDQYPLAFVRDPYGLGTDIYEMQSPTEWIEVGGELPESHGVFAPIQTDNGWFGYTWEMWHTATLWHSESATGPYTEVETNETPTRTYDHGLNVVDGAALHRWSDGEGEQRVGYEPFVPPTPPVTSSTIGIPTPVETPEPQVFVCVPESNVELGSAGVWMRVTSDGLVPSDDPAPCDSADAAGIEQAVNVYNECLAGIEPERCN